MHEKSFSSMKVVLPPKGGIIFICYRRSDSSGYVGRIRETLAKKFKKRSVFLDLEMGPGRDFVRVTTGALRATSVFLAIIGPEWLQTEDAHGRLRLADPEDYVRLEIQAALQQGLTVIPVLVGGARLPSAEELPDGLRQLVKFQAFELSNIRWEYDLSRLVAAIRPIVDPWFLYRRVGWGLAAAALAIAAFLGSRKIIENRQFNQGIEQAMDYAKGGDKEKALRVLDSLQEKMPQRAARISLETAQVYLMTGDYPHQYEAAAKAIRQAGGDYFVLGRARALACDAESELNLSDDPQSDCDRAEQDSIRARDPEGQVRAINFKANILAKAGKSKEALEAYQRALGIAKDKGLLLDQCGALFNIGLILADRKNDSDQKEARNNFELARQGFEDLGMLGEASNVYNELGSLSLGQGDIETAQKNFDKALELAIRGGDQDSEKQARVNLGLVRQQSASLSIAEKELLDELDIYHKAGGGRETSDVAFLKNSLGDVYLQQAKYDDAKKAYADAERIRGKLPEAGPQAFSMACLVNLDLQRDIATGITPNTDDLLKRIKLAIDQAANAGDSYSESFAYLVKARILLPQHQDQANEQAKKALELAGENQADNTFLARIIIAEIDALRGNTKRAFDELEKLKNSAEHNGSLGQELEAQLAYLKMMRETGSPPQRSKAKNDLIDFGKKAYNKDYKLLADQAAQAGRS